MPPGHDAWVVGKEPALFLEFGEARAFAVVTASTVDGAAPDWAELAAAADTLVVLMAAARLEEVCAALLRAGRPAAQPAAIVEAATTEAQRSVRATLGTLASVARAAGIGPAATLVVGEVVSLADRLAVAQVRSTSVSTSGNEPILGPSHTSTSGR